LKDTSDTEKLVRKIHETTGKAVSHTPLRMLLAIYFLEKEQSILQMKFEILHIFD